MTDNNICRMDNVIRRFDWLDYTFVMVSVIPFTIMLFNWLIFNRIIPDWFIDQYIVLTYSSPNLVSMFLSNYAHATIVHMVENMMSYILVIAFIIVVALVFIPFFNRKNPGMHCRFGTKTMVNSTLIFFLIVPFIISSVSIVAGLILGKTDGLGFSGIIFAFEGYLVYISEILIIRKIQVVLHNRDKKLAYLGMFLAAMIPMMVVIGQVLTMYTSILNTNYIAHMTGFFVGFMTPMMLERLQEKQKISNISE